MFYLDDYGIKNQVYCQWNYNNVIFIIINSLTPNDA